MDMAYLLIGVLVLLAREPLQESIRLAEVNFAYRQRINQAQHSAAPAESSVSQKVVEDDQAGESVFISVREGGCHEIGVNGVEHPLPVAQFSSRIEAMAKPRVVVLVVGSNVTYGQYIGVRSSLQDLKSKGLVTALLETAEAPQL